MGQHGGIHAPFHACGLPHVLFAFGFNIQMGVIQHGIIRDHTRHARQIVGLHLLCIFLQRFIVFFERFRQSVHSIQNDSHDAGRLGQLQGLIAKVA